MADMESTFNNFLSSLGSQITASQLRSIKKMLSGHIDKHILSLTNNGHDLMFTLVQLKFVSPIKLAFLRKLCNVSDGEELLHQIDSYQSNAEASKQGFHDVQKRLAILEIIVERQCVTHEEYKTRLESVLIKYKALLQQKEDLTASIAQTKAELKKMQKEEQEERWDMEALIQLRIEKEGKRRIEVYNLRKLLSERDDVIGRMDKLTSDLSLRGKARVNTFDRANLKSEYRKCESESKLLTEKINKQEERVDSIEKDVKLFSLEKSERKETLRVCELAVDITTRNISNMFNDLDEVNGNVLIAMEELHSSKAACLELEHVARLTKEDMRCISERSVTTQHDIPAVEEILQPKPKVMNYDILGSQSFIIKPLGCKQLVAVEIDKNGDILTVDKEGKKLILLTLDGRTKRTIHLDTLSPLDVTINSDDNYVVIGKQELRIYDSKNEHLLTKCLPFYICEEMHMPHFVSVAANKEEGEIYILDKSNLSIQVFTNDGRFDHVKHLSGYVSSPCRIQLLNKQEFMISDDVDHNIKIFHTQRLYSYKTIGNPGYGFCEYVCPSGLDKDVDGNIVVADRENHRIHVMTKHGHHISMYGRFGTSEKKLDNPCDVAVYPCGIIVVVDMNNNRIAVYY